jgi:predicted Zn-dependent protease
MHELEVSQKFGVNTENGQAENGAHRSEKSRPTYASLWEHLGRLLDKQNKISSARKAYTRALLLDSQDDLVKGRLSELQKKPPIDYASSTVIKNMEAKNRVVI